MADNNFWANPLVEPKRSFRWYVSIAGAGEEGQGNLSFATWTAKNVSKPSLTVQEITHRYVNHTFYYPGRLEWNPVTLTLVDPLSPDASKNIAHLLQLAGYRLPSTAEEARNTTISKASATKALGDVRVYQMDGAADALGPGANSEVVEEWVLKNCFIQAVNFGQLDYDSEEIVTIELTLRYDWAYIKDTVEGSRS